MDNFDLLKRHKFGSEIIYNINKIGIETVQDTTCVLVEKGIKLVGKVISAEQGELVTER